MTKKYRGFIEIAEEILEELVALEKKVDTLMELYTHPAKHPSHSSLKSDR